MDYQQPESQCCCPPNAAVCKEVSLAEQFQPALIAGGWRFCYLPGLVARLNPIEAGFPGHFN
jgi:hypothetical protein